MDNTKKIDNHKLPKNIHSEHRTRLRHQAIVGGLKSLNEHQVLELLLTYCIPRKDVNPIAHRLINEFGSLRNVLDADIALLKNINGVGDKAASFLKLLPDFFRVYLMSNIPDKIYIKSPADVYRYFIPTMKFLLKEELLVVLLDQKSKLIKCETFCSDSVDKVNVDINSITKFVLNNSGKAVILLHNHIDDSVKPSFEDIKFTTIINHTFSLLNITFIDHIIVNNNSDDKYSFNENGYIKDTNLNLVNKFEYEISEEITVKKPTEISSKPAFTDISKIKRNGLKDN